MHTSACASMLGQRRAKFQHLAYKMCEIIGWNSNMGRIFGLLQANGARVLDKASIDNVCRQNMDLSHAVVVVGDAKWCSLLTYRTTTTSFCCYARRGSFNVFQPVLRLLKKCVFV